jgi:hypothetical protein
VNVFGVSLIYFNGRRVKDYGFTFQAVKANFPGVVKRGKVILGKQEKLENQKR